jgi:cytidyltransferase-like protein
MRFKQFLSEKAEPRKVVVVYGGGFQPFHAGHMSSYEEAKRAFPKAEFYVAASNDTKNRPIPFADKRFLAQQAGVVDHFVQVVQPVNPQEILSHYNPEKDVLILVRSERDPVNYTKKDGSAAYYQPFKSLKDCVSFNPKGGHGYIFVTKKKIFKIGQKEVFSGSQVRDMYQKADESGRRVIVKALYPQASSTDKVKRMLDKYIGGVKESIDEHFEEFADVLTEGVHDKSIFKAVFMGGGPGSGKDYVLDKTLAGHGLTEINSDKALEYLMDKRNLDKRMPQSQKGAREIARTKAKTMTELRQKLALQGRNGLIINGTGDDHAKIKKIKDRLEELGYESSMIMVNTRDEVSASRNVERGQRGGRSVPEDIRKEKWQSVQNARPELAKMFGDNYSEIDNSDDLRAAAPEVRAAKEKEFLDLYKKIQKFVKAPPKNDEAKQWVASELDKKDTQPIPKGESSIAPHPESGATDEARRLGLQYYGFGRYGQKGKVTYRVIHDKLVAVEKLPTVKPVVKEETMMSEAVTFSITGDTPEEVNALFNTMFNKNKPEEVDEEKVDEYFSNSSATNLLTLGKKYSVIESNLDSVTFSNEDIANILENKEDMNNYLKGENGKIRVFMLRRSAAKEAHLKGGTVQQNTDKKQGGYIVQLHEEKNNDTIYQKPIQEAFNNRNTGNESNRTRITISEIRSRANSTESGRASFLTEGTEPVHGRADTFTGHQDKQTLAAQTLQPNLRKTGFEELRSKQKEKAVKESIDKGIETGLSMAGAGESLGRDMGEKIRKKDSKVTPVSESGDETGASIGAQKEDELKKKGINLSTFKSKNYL